MPDLRRILQAQMDSDRFRLRPERFLSLVQILIGIANDGPGWISVPGKGPVPVDPEWGRRGVDISPSKRDLITAMAVHELSAELRDDRSRQQVAGAATKAMRAAVEQLEKQGRA